MNKPFRLVFLLVAIAVVIGLGVWSLPGMYGNETDQVSRARFLLARSAGGDSPTQDLFRRAAPSYRLKFPQDFGPHPDFQTEWWYYTGNLTTPDGRRFGYQLTFFRRGVVPPDQQLVRESSWAVEQVYLAHFALSDIGDGGFHAYEKLARGAAGLAGARAEPYEVWLYDWLVEEISPGTYRMAASQGGHAIELQLTDRKGPVLQGIDGYSQKGPEEGNASHYYSQTRLETEGVVTVGGQNYPVSGTSWMDHEFSTSAFSEGVVGWDWFSIQLDDGSELMVYQFRRQDGTVGEFLSGMYIYPDGGTQYLSRDDFTIEVLDEWESPHSGATYPSGWMLKVLEIGADLEVLPLQLDQELNLSYSYWEGAVALSGFVGDASVSGVGYVELTGYADSLAGEF